MNNMKGCYGNSGKMIDNQKGNVSRQAGIERVLQKGNMQVGQGGKMSNGKSGGSFKSSGDSLTPRKA